MLHPKLLQLLRPRLFAAYAYSQAALVKEAGCYSRAANYTTAIRSFTAAVGDLPLRHITADTVAAYQQYLKDKGICPNTMSCYNRSLRAIYNRAVAEGIVRDRQPFEACFTGRMKTDKRSIGSDHIRLLRTAELDHHPSLERARDYFLFSFYAMGMPFIDIAFLRHEQITGDILSYDRHKTRQHVRVPLIPEARQLIRKYAGRRSPYVFPILTATDSRAAYDEYCTQLNAYNRSLKKLARRAGIPDLLTSYTMRHSWASLAYKADVPIGVISQALGHARPDVTMTYIRELDDSTMRNCNQRVLDTVLG